MEKAESKEISVGDWFQARMVKIDYEDLDITPPMRVAEISSDEGVLQLGSVKHYAFIEDLQPIPITAEVLERNGWSRDVHSNNIWSYNEDYYVTMTYFFEGSRLMIWSWSDSISLSVRYVHELQHCMRLARVDKEFNM